MDSERSKNIIKIIITGVILIIVTGFCLVTISKYYSNNLVITMSAETVVSILLAFFSIGISVAFYFKANDTSTRFYNSSYEFMKEQSILLGRIEERFGERLGNVQSILQNMLPITQQKEDTERLVKEITEYKDIFDKLISESGLPPNEKKRIEDQINQKEQIIINIQKEKEDALNEINKYLDEINNDYQNDYNNKWSGFYNDINHRYHGKYINKMYDIAKQIPKKAVNMIERKVNFSKMSDLRKRQGLEAGIFDADGNISPIGISFFAQS